MKKIKNSKANEANNILGVNSQKIVFEDNEHNRGYHMTIETMRVFQPEKYDIISKYFETHGNNLNIGVGYQKHSTPVVDITAGRIYPNLALGKNSLDMNDYIKTRAIVVTVIEKKIPYFGTAKLTDFTGNCINEHLLMYAEDVPIAIIEEIIRKEKRNRKYCK